MIMMILALIVGVTGAVLLSFGAWLVYVPAGYLTAGLLCLLWSWMVSKSMALNSHSKQEGD